jgi:hypothetical protein
MLRFWNTFLSFQEVLWLHLAMFRSLRAALGMDGPQADFGGTLWSTNSLLLKMAQYIVDLHGFTQTWWIFPSLFVSSFTRGCANYDIAAMQTIKDRAKTRRLQGRRQAGLAGRQPGRTCHCS